MRLFLFVYLNKQTTNADDDHAKLENFGSTHWAAPPFERIRGQDAPLYVQGTNRLPLIDSAWSNNSTEFVDMQAPAPCLPLEGEVSALPTDEVK